MTEKDRSSHESTANATAPGTVVPSSVSGKATVGLSRVTVVGWA